MSTDEFRHDPSFQIVFYLRSDIEINDDYYISIFSTIMKNGMNDEQLKKLVKYAHRTTINEEYLIDKNLGAMIIMYCKDGTLASYIGMIDGDFGKRFKSYDHNIMFFNSIFYINSLFESGKYSPRRCFVSPFLHPRSPFYHKLSVNLFNTYMNKLHSDILKMIPYSQNVKSARAV